jgi:hypothetical protein
MEKLKYVVNGTLENITTFPIIENLLPFLEVCFILSFVFLPFVVLGLYLFWLKTYFNGKDMKSIDFVISGLLILLQIVWFFASMDVANDVR